MARGWFERKSSYKGRTVAIKHSWASRMGWSKRRTTVGYHQSPFWTRAQRELGSKYDVRSPDFMKRRMWFTAMIERGKEGQIDNRTRAKKVYPLTEKNYQRWIKDKNFRKKFDVEDIDTPLPDVEEIKVHGTSIYVGGRNKAGRQNTKDLVRKVLKNNFTADEVRSIKNLYIEQLPYKIDRDARHSADTMRGGRRANIIELNKNKAKEETLTHELTHAVRWMKGLDARTGKVATPTDEKKAELETVARVSPKAFRNRSDIGYYSMHPTPSQARESDRRAVSGTIKPNKGSVSTRVEKHYPKSQIKKVKL